MTKTHDPWARVIPLRPNPYSHQNYYVKEEVDSARAAVERQHAAALAEKDAQIAGVSEQPVQPPATPQTTAAVLGRAVAGQFPATPQEPTGAQLALADIEKAYAETEVALAQVV
ncbi:MAG: hypothetical protein E6R03_01910, partial [Hyphomicrobiaceae bacterium]